MTAPNLNIRMAAALITLDADVDWKGGQFSTWELCPSWLCEELLQDSAPLEEESFKDYRGVFLLDYVPIMKCMISLGVDPHAVVSVAHQHSPTFEQFLSTYVRPKYLAEADEISLEWERAIAANSPERLYNEWSDDHQGPQANDEDSLHEMLARDFLPQLSLEESIDFLL